MSIDADLYWTRAAENRGNAWMTNRQWLRKSWLATAEHLEKLAINAEQPSSSAASPQEVARPTP